MKVVSADFTPIVPYETDVLHIQSGQRYNVIVEMDQVSKASTDSFSAGVPTGTLTHGEYSPKELTSYAQSPRQVVVSEA